MKAKRTMECAAAVLLIGGCFGNSTQEKLDAWSDLDGVSELAVDFRDDVTEAQIEAIEQRLGLDLRYNSEHAVDEVLTIAEVPSAKMREVAHELLDTDLVEAVEPNYIYHALDFTPNDPLYAKQWHMAKIGMPEAWEKTQGEGATVAVIDTGVAYEDYKHFKRAPDLEGVEFVKGYNFVADTTHANDDHGHGTHCTGTIAQATNNNLGVTGIAFKAKIMPVKVLARSGGGTAADIADAMRWAADHGANVLSLSLGGGPYSRIMEAAVSYARRKGVLVVCAAGNGGRRKVEYPAAYKDAFAVSSTGPDDALAFYSSYGPEVAIAAPGGDKSRSEEHGVLQQTITRGDPSQFAYEWYQGTSMATPHVAGAAALLYASGVTNPDEVARILKETADDIGERGRDDKFGDGRLNAAKAVTAAPETGTVYGRSGIIAALLSLLFVGALRSNGRSAPAAIVRMLVGAGVALGMLSLTTLPEFRGFLLSHGLLMHPAIASAGLPLLVAMLFARTHAALVCGFACGFAGFLFQQEAFGVADITYIPNLLGGTLDNVWLVLNAALSVGIAGVVALRGAR